MNNKLALLIIKTLAVVLILHLVAIFFKFYWTTWWFDHIVHFIAGVSVGFAYIFFRKYFYWLERYTGYFVGLFLFVLFVGILWEIFEWYMNLASSVEGYWLDTSVDVVCDVLGGVFAFLYIKEKNEDKN